MLPSKSAKIGLASDENNRRLSTRQASQKSRDRKLCQVSLPSASGGRSILWVMQAGSLRTLHNLRLWSLSQKTYCGFSSMNSGHCRTHTDQFSVAVQLRCVSMHAYVCFEILLNTLACTKANCSYASMRWGRENTMTQQKGLVLERMLCKLGKVNTASTTLTTTSKAGPVGCLVVPSTNLKNPPIDPLGCCWWVQL